MITSLSGYNPDRKDTAAEEIQRLCRISLTPVLIAGDWRQVLFKGPVLARDRELHSTAYLPVAINFARIFRNNGIFNVNGSATIGFPGGDGCVIYVPNC